MTWQTIGLYVLELIMFVVLITVISWMAESGLKGKKEVADADDSAAALFISAILSYTIMRIIRTLFFT